MAKSPKSPRAPTVPSITPESDEAKAAGPAGSGPAERGTGTDTAPPPTNVSSEVWSIRTARGIRQFRRAGFEFTQAPRPLRRADLSTEQLAALEGEPRLIIVKS